MNVVYAERILSRDRGDRTRPVDAICVERLEVRLNAGSSPAVAARDGERDGLRDGLRGGRKARVGRHLLWPSVGSGIFGFGNWWHAWA